MAISTIGQNSMGSNVSQTAPCFSAYLNSGQTITFNTFAKVNCNVKEFDTNNFYSTSTYQFVPTIAGYYQVTAAAQINFTSSSQSAFSAIYKNGSAFKIGMNTMNTNVYNQVTVSALIYMNGTTDYLEFWVQQNSGSNQTVGGNQNTTYFQAVMVRAA